MPPLLFCGRPPPNPHPRHDGHYDQVPSPVPVEEEMTKKTEWRGEKQTVIVPNGILQVPATML